MTRTPSVAVRCWLAATVLGLAPAAQAYLDPSTGSMILSAVVGIFATISLAVKTYWYKLKSLFRRSPQAPPPRPAGEAPVNERPSPPAGRR